MKRVYFVQASLSYGKAYYYPYATGCLAAYAWQFETIQSEYEISEFIFKREPVDVVMERINEPAVMAFSCYNWTFEYNKCLARAIKEKYPDCLIVFGGHQISENVEIFDELPFVDVLIYGEGERPFREILEAYACNESFDSISNIAYRRLGEYIHTRKENYKDLKGYVSPYLGGYFENIYKNNPGVEFCAVIETNRGCPYNCSYCDWCYTTDIREFPLEKIKKEILWCSEHKVEYIFCADSNFGILKRDLDIARFVVEVKQKNGYPHIFNNCFAKNSNDTVFEISKLFYDNKLNKAATLAYQTVCEVALKNVNRKNFTMEAFSDLVTKYNANNMPTYTEMILGLPGETYESFCSGLCRLIDAGQQTALTVYYCQVYPNSLMGKKEYREKFGIKTARVPLNYLHSSMPDYEDITEYTDLVVGTRDMPFEDIIKAIMFCTCLQCFHHIGLLKYFALYLNKEKGIRYIDFYTSLLDYIFSSKGTQMNKLFCAIESQCSDFSNGEWSYYNEKFGNIGWFLEEGAFMELVADFDTFWDEIKPFLKGFSIDPEVFDELVTYQKNVIRLPFQEHVKINLKYDLYNYFNSLLSGKYEPLTKRANTIEVDIPNPVYSWEDYARKVVLFAKRRGDTIITSDKKYMRIQYH